MKRTPLRRISKKRAKVQRQRSAMVVAFDEKSVSVLVHF